MAAREQNWERTLDHSDASGTRRLHVAMLEGQREDKLEQGLRNVELQRVLQRNENQGVIEQNGFPAINYRPDVEHVEEDSDRQLVFIWYLVVIWL